MDTFVDSVLVLHALHVPGCADTMVDARNDYWMPMDQYIGGIEHAILHLLYARFWTKVMRDMGLVRFDEPFTRLFTQGMLLNHIWSRRNDKGGIDYFPPQDVTPRTDEHGRVIGGTLPDGRTVEYGGVGKMGKTENNGVDPQDVIDRYGADTARLFVMFAGPPGRLRRVVGHGRRRPVSASCDGCGRSRTRSAGAIAGARRAIRLA